MTKLVFISDTHLRDIVLPEGDFLFHSGDYLMNGNLKEWYRNLEWIKRERPKFKHWVTTFGNHDKYCQTNLNLVKTEMVQEVKAVVLVDESAYIDGLKIYGTPWIPRIGLYPWAWEADRGNAIAKHWKKIPNGLDILLTHTAPYGISDQSIKRNGHLSEHYGCFDLEDTITRVMPEPPKINSFGHIHQTPEQQRITDNGITKFINAAMLDDFYEVVNEPIIVEV